VGVLTKPDSPKGRSKKPVPSNVALAAENLQIPIIKALYFDEAIRSNIYDLEFDVGLVVAYGGLIPEDVLKIPKFGWINVHFSLLPDLRGAAPVERAILRGDTKFGVSIFKLVKELDAGPVIGSFEFNLVQPTVENVFQESIDRSIQLLKELLHDPKNWELNEQDHSAATYAHKIDKEEFRIDLRKEAFAIDRQIRAFFPSAFLIFRDQRLSILEAQVSSINLSPGEYQIGEGMLFIGTGRESLQILKVKPEGKRALTVREWLNGIRFKNEDHFL
jgi:methionyl-tRNA formyltransferase